MTSHGKAFRLRFIAIASFAVAAVAVFVWFEGLAGVDVLPSSTYTLRAQAPSVVSMSAHADVLEAGVKVGTVEGINEAGGRAQLTMSLGEQYAPVYRDAQIQIRAKTLIGENYVALDPGTRAAGALPNGAMIPALAPEATQLDQILSTFDAPHRRALAQLLDVLGAGLSGNGTAVNRMLGASADLVDKASPVAAVLAADRVQTASLIDDFGTVATALGDRAADIHRLVRAIKDAGVAVSSRDDALRAMLRALPSFIAQAQTTIGHLGAFSRAATPVIHDLQIATTDLIPAMYALGPAARTGRAVLRELGPFAEVTTRTASALQRFSPVATALAGPLETTLRQANPLLAYLEPYALDLGSLFPSMEAPVHYRDASAGFGRVASIQSNNLVTGVNPSEDTVVLALEKAGLLPMLAVKDYNPYPKPGTAGHPVPYSGKYPHITEDPPYRLPR